MRRLLDERLFLRLRFGAQHRAKIIQKKTGNSVQFEITSSTRDAINDLVSASKLEHHDWLFPSRKDKSAKMKTRQYSRLVKSWVHSIGLSKSAFGTHSLRRTKATMIYRKTGNLRAIQLVLGHEKIDSTVKYLGVEVEEALALSESIEI